MRIDLNVIMNWIQPNSHILDLACGNGTLLDTLMKKKAVTGYGLEIDPEEINRCISKGVNVLEHNLNQGLGNFSNKSFDAVVMTQALQTMHYPHLLLEDMLRVGKECIVTFPNFGHWKARLHLFFKGKMPVSDLLPYTWYNTPNIHFCTFKDFEVLCQSLGITILHRQVVAEHRLDHLFKGIRPNLFGETAIYHLTRNGNHETN